MNKNLDPLSFLEVLQKEYVVFELRTKIYTRECDKKYWQDLADKKKERILNISNSKNFSNIFTDKSFNDYIYKCIIPKKGFPIFLYRDEEQKRKIQKWDKFNYYSTGEKFIIYNLQGEEINKGTMIQLCVDRDSAYLEVNDKVSIFDLNNISRIL